jgi:uroporphyrinogen-III synthase
MVAPLFELRAIDWDPPEPGRFQALMLTSVNGAVHAGPSLGQYVGLPCYCVGEATAAAARESGLGRLVLGEGDARALVERMAQDEIGCALHLSGREHLEINPGAVRIERRVVYAADAAGDLSPEAQSALRAGALALVHSPRAARRFAALVDKAVLARSTIRIAAISGNAVAALGAGWHLAIAAETPTDQALLELATKLCKTEPMGGSDHRQ